MFSTHFLSPETHLYVAVGNWLLYKNFRVVVPNNLNELKIIAVAVVAYHDKTVDILSRTDRIDDMRTSLNVEFEPFEISIFSIFADRIFGGYDGKPRNLARYDDAIRVMVTEHTPKILEIAHAMNRLGI